VTREAFVRVTAQGLLPGDLIISTGRTMHQSKGIRVSSVVSQVGGTVQVRGVTLYTPTDGVVFRALNSHLPITVRRVLA
jgi:hypothetical protein